MKRILFVLSLLLLAIAPAAFGDIMVAVNPNGQVIGLGGNAIVTIDSSGGYVGDFDLNIAWNPGIVALASASYGGQLGFALENPPVFGAGTVNASSISLEFPADLIALQPGQTATLLTLVFQGVGLGTSPVTLGYNAIGDEMGIAHQVVALANGSITVVDGQGAEIPEPSSVFLLATAAGLVLHRMRKRFA